MEPVTNIVVPFWKRALRVTGRIALIAVPGALVGAGLVLAYQWYRENHPKTEESGSERSTG